jgi:protein involved in polysaccharide export with SLBB domain
LTGVVQDKIDSAGFQTYAGQTTMDQSTGKRRNANDPCSKLSGSLPPECQARDGLVDSSYQEEGRDFAGRLNYSGGKEDKQLLRKQEFSWEEPSEFQRFIASSIGRLLPIFGTSLFEKAPTTFAPLDRVPVTADYVIGPGDEILLRIWGQQTFNLKLTVDRSGAIYLPQAGNISVAGIQFKQISDYLRSQLERVFRNFDLSVNMGQLRSIQVFVMGNARRPGSYTVSSLSTLVNALFASGGPSSSGSMRRIQLKRGSLVVAELDLYDLLLRGDKSADLRLQPEDVIYIPPIGAQVAAAGSLRNQAIYELKNELNVHDLIQMAGGLTPVADRRRAKLERIKDGAVREIVDVDLSESGQNASLVDGDLLRIAAVTPRFENAVTLRGNVANPGRFRWNAGMRLRDIIPDKESLVTRDYWRRRNLLGFAPPDELLILNPKSERGSKPAASSIQSVIPDINWSYAVIERQDPQNLTAKLIPFHLGRLILEKDEGQNLELHSGDVVTVFSQTDIRVPQMQQTRTIRLEGEFGAPGIYTVSPGETLGQVIQKAGGLTLQAYLFGAEFLRESTQRDQQSRLDRYITALEQEVETASRNRLGNANNDEVSKLEAEIQNQKLVIQRLRAIRSTGRIVLSLQPGDNDLSAISAMTLENNDQFIVPAKPATINVMGDVYNPSSFVHSEKREVGEYLKLAGGFTRSADEDRSYIIRADGSVLPKQNTSNFFKLRLNPGDTIVAPEHLFKTTFLAGLRTWSQVISQFGLGAAAVNVLR